MELTVKERLQLLMVLPSEGNVTTIRIVRKLREMLSFTEEEHEFYGFEETGGHLKWKPDVPQSKEIEFGPKAHLILRETLQSLNDKKAITEDFLPLWDKFFPPEE